jgi:hypothetical protein
VASLRSSPYSGNLGRIELSTGHFTELPMDENGAFDIAW